jgi:acyl-CoA reductase-like NAD-dependent aldehyde dehydrogenase
MPQQLPLTANIRILVQLAEMCVQGGLPADVLNVVTGNGPETGIALCNHPHIRKIDLTGGTATGRAVGAAAGKNLSSFVAELGGKTPMLIFEDADITHAINTAAFAAFVASGQTCVTGSRALIHKSIFDEVVDKLAAKASKIRLGDPFDMTTQMGPVISRASKAKILAMLERAKQEGAVVKAGGAAATSLPAPFDKGHYILPTVLAVKPNSEIAREEVFGPVLACYPFEDEKDAVRLANDSPYGLAASVYTKDIMRAHRVADQLDCGIVWINDHHRNDPSSPWGGVRDSGIGRENGFDALHEYTQSKSVVVRKDNSTFDWFEQPNARYG